MSCSFHCPGCHLFITKSRALLLIVTNTIRRVKPGGWQDPDARKQLPAFFLSQTQDVLVAHGPLHALMLPSQPPKCLPPVRPWSNSANHTHWPFSVCVAIVCLSTDSEFTLTPHSIEKGRDPQNPQDPIILLPFSTSLYLSHPPTPILFPICQLTISTQSEAIRTFELGV